MPVGLRDLGRQDVKYAKIDAAGSATTALVTLTAAEIAAGKKVCVVSYYGCSAGNTTFIFKSFDNDSTYTDLTGTMRIENDSSGMSADWSPDGHFETLAGESLVVTNGGSNAVGGHLSYFLYE
tara:strand:+ start:741 stop:1109 length:369 start_codon:yes stop_codon:yes gene_type:complete